MTQALLHEALALYVRHGAVHAWRISSFLVLNFTTIVLPYALYICWHFTWQVMHFRDSPDVQACMTWLHHKARSARQVSPAAKENTEPSSC